MHAHTHSHLLLVGELCRLKLGLGILDEFVKDEKCGSLADLHPPRQPPLQ